MLTFFEALTQQEKATCLSIRRVVFIEGQNVPQERELHGEEKHCAFFGVKENDATIATLRITIEGTVASLQRMAVLPDYRNKGVGRFMLNALLTELTNKTDLTHIHLNSQEHAVTFYRRAGFNVISDAFKDANITHYKMERELR